MNRLTIMIDIRNIYKLPILVYVIFIGLVHTVTRPLFIDRLSITDYNGYSPYAPL